ncbi:MAG: hypothetical protein NXI04_00640 [Planctomycetaceae bacterium]|nr:hypothetical protein [Planctomycetaceae bacterium]
MIFKSFLIVMLASGLAATTLPAEDGGKSSRQLQLPDTPYRYADIKLPTHFAAVASKFDNTPPDNPITDHGATLGRVLFYDTSLSANGTTSCASCHQQQHAFAEPRAVSIGFDGRPVTRNSMSLVNARYYASGKFFWDERAATLERQVLLPIENEIEMGHSLPVLVRQLQRDPLYPPLFKDAFGTETVTTDRIAKALAQFIRSIVSCRSRFDEGVSQVDHIDDPFPNFTDEENLGKQQFLHRGGCATCHLRTQPNGDPQSAFFFVDKATVNGVDAEVIESDTGKGRVTGNRAHDGAFKSPSLRNVALTGPYMHDGRFATLDRVLEHYNWSVRPHPNLDDRLADAAANGIAIPERQKVALAVFLETLTDQALLQDPRFADPFVRPGTR